VGAGETWEEITRPLFWETSEGRLAIVNWVFPETHPDWMCTPGPNCWPGRQEAGQIIQDLKRQVDWVLVLAHWSDELFAYPRPQDRKLARELAAMGADVIVGHHPHVVRGMEVMGVCPVFYSVGNFYFSNIPDGQGGWIDRPSPRMRQELGVEVSFRRGERPAYRLWSFWQLKNRVVLDSKHRAVTTLERVSQPLHQFQGAEYADWYAKERAVFEKWGIKWHFRLWLLGRRGVKRNLLKPWRYLLQRVPFLRAGQ